MKLIPILLTGIKTQYKDYCDKLEELTDIATKTELIKDEIKLLILLIEK